MEIHRIKREFDVLKILILKEWIVKYKSTLLGYLWSIMHPLMLAFVFFIAFKVVVKVPIENYTLFLVTGLFPWQWFMNSVTIGVWSFVSNASLIKKTLFPKYLLTLSVTVLDMIHFVISIPIVMFLLYLYDYPPFHWSWLYQIPIVILLQLLISFALGLIFGTLNVFFRDIDRIVSLILTLMMYLTPIFYSLDMVPPSLMPYFYINPMVSIVELWRDVFMHGVLNLPSLGIACINLIVLLFIAFRVYKRYAYQLAEHL